MKLVTKEFNSNLVTFDLSSDMMISLTDMAKANGKEAWRWLDLESTKSYLAVIAKLGKNEVITKQGVNGGTWASKRVAIRFAQWLSDEFAIWVDTQIEELLTKGVVAMPTSYRDAIAQLLIEIDAKEEAIRTKAEIGSRREATSMATAGIATKQRNAMSITVDKHQAWASVLRVEQVTGKKYSWKLLKEYCLEHNLEIKKVNSGMETRFSQVNTYPAEAWYECYGIDVTEFRKSK